MMVNAKKKSGISTKAGLLMTLREKAGQPVSGEVLAKLMGVSRVAVWKGIQALSLAGYPIETFDTGYSLNLQKTGDFLYPWEFGEREAMFRHYESTGSTMDRAREFAVRGPAAEMVITTERQSAGRGRNGRAWASRHGGLFFTILDSTAFSRSMALAEYNLPAMIFQIAAARALASLTGKSARLRWPNDVYVDHRKIAGVMTELSGEGDIINWLAAGIGVNVNNPVPSGRAVSCAEIAGHQFSRREVLLKIIDEAEQLKKRINSGTVYAQGNRLLAAEWNSLADFIGAKAAIVDSGREDLGKPGKPEDAKGRIFARGIFAGVDPAGRCILKPENGERALYFNPGPVSLVFLSV